MTIQVAFGTDFTQQIESNETKLQLSSAPERKSLTSLVDIAFIGFNKTLRLPGYQVIVAMYCIFFYISKIISGCIMLRSDRSTMSCLVACYTKSSFYI